MRTIRFRLGVLVFGCLVIAFASGLGVIYVTRLTDRTVDHALDAQRRLDLLTELSGRIQQYGLIAIAAVDDPASGTARLKETEAEVLTAIGNFEPELAKAIRSADLPAGANAMAARARPLEQVRAGFRVLVRQIGQALKETDTPKRNDLTRGAFNGFATFTGPYLFFLMQADRRGVEAGREEARAVSATLTRSALALVALALAVSVAFYRLISRPILAAVAEIRDAAIAIGQGERNLRLPVRHRDELGLLAVVFNRMTARLRRGESRVARDRLALESTIADRTADLRLANARLSEIDQSRRRFFADVSHELRTPLTVILGECDVALGARAFVPAGGSAADGLPDSAQRDAFAVIRRRARRLQRRVEDMLRVARSESGTLELRFEPVVLQGVCASAIDAFEGATKRRDVAIALEDPGERDVVVDGDFEWLRQIVEGMIDNALRYAAGATRIVLRVDRHDEGALLAVRDDGAGWNVSDPQILLGRFSRRVDGDAGRKPVGTVAGHGIGLSLVAWVVDKHGGRVTLGTAEPPLGGAEIAIIFPPAHLPHPS